MNQKIPAKHSNKQPANPGEHKAVPQEVIDAVRGLPKDQREKILISVEASLEQYQGPLPHPEHLKEFNEIIPNGAERIMAVYERQVLHRHDLEKGQMAIHSRSTIIGQVFGFIMCILVLAFAAYAISMGQTATAISTVIAQIVFVGGAFVYTKMSKNRPKK